MGQRGERVSARGTCENGDFLNIVYDIYSRDLSPVIRSFFHKIAILLALDVVRRPQHFSSTHCKCI